MARTGKKKVRRPKRPSAGNVTSSSMEIGNSSAALPPTKVWQPGVDAINDDEVLEYEPTAYNCLHAFHLGWPCLSFDMIRDSYGALRHEFPHTMFCVAGTQADTSANNKVIVAKLSNITGKKRPAVAKNEENGESSDSDESDDEDMGVESSDRTPKLQELSLPHRGCVNRVRAMQQQPHIVATWSDVGHVQVWDVSAQLNFLASDDVVSDAPSNGTSQILQGHKDEGFALDWSPMTVGRLASGDCKSTIRIWEPTSGGKWVGDKIPCLGHKASVEDLQWSPTEAEMLASCSVDGTIGIWDLRSHHLALSFKAHDTDVNVISWNRRVAHLLASGGDDGILRVWDLREVAKGDYKPLANYEYHSKPITSVEWNPHDPSILAVTCADNQLTIWDLSLERDKEEEAQFEAELGRPQAEAPSNIPGQLVFSHQGQKDMKELHWHPQIEGVIVSTAADGFNLFRPSNLEHIG